MIVQLLDWRRTSIIGINCCVQRKLKFFLPCMLTLLWLLWVMLPGRPRPSLHLICVMRRAEHYELQLYDGAARADKIDIVNWGHNKIPLNILCPSGAKQTLRREVRWGWRRRIPQRNTKKAVPGRSAAVSPQCDGSAGREWPLTLQSITAATIAVSHHSNSDIRTYHHTTPHTLPPHQVYQPLRADGGVAAGMWSVLTPISCI